MYNNDEDVAQTKEKFAKAKASFLNQFGSEFDIVVKNEKSHRQHFMNDLARGRDAIVRSFSEINDMHIPAGAEGSRGGLVFLEMDTPKAFATSVGGFDFVALSIGLCARLWAFSALIAIHMMSETGSESLDLSGQSCVLDQVIDARLDLEFKLLPDIDNGLCSSFRRTIFISAMLWVSHHELAHIWNGHIAYKSSDRYRYSNLDKRGIEMALELDANQRAACGIIVEAQSVERATHIAKFDRVHREGVKKANDFLLVIGVISALLFAVMWESKAKRRLIYHPHPKVILLAVVQMLIALFSRRYGEESQGLVTASFQNVMNTINETSNQHYRASIHFEDEAEYMELIRKGQETWNSICSEVVKTARGFRLSGIYKDGFQSGYVYKDGWTSQLAIEASKTMYGNKYSTLWGDL